MQVRGAVDLLRIVACKDPSQTFEFQFVGGSDFIGCIITYTKMQFLWKCAGT